MSNIAREEPLTLVAYLYDGTPEGLLTAVFAAYAAHEDPQDIAREQDYQPRLGQSIRTVDANPVLAERVERSIRSRCGDDAFEAVLHASLSDDPSAGNVVYRFIKHALPPGKAEGSRSAQTRKRPPRRSRTLNDLANPAVGQLVQLDRSVMNERHLMQQFLRFTHLSNGTWFARCNPKANVVPLLMDFFAGRFNDEAFVIYDENHHVAGIHGSDGWGLAHVDGIEVPEPSDEEGLMQAGWKRFYDAVSIEARYHPELRRQFMPKRLWRNILEVRDEAPGINRIGSQRP